MNDIEIVIQRLIELNLAQNASEAEQWLHNETTPGFKKTGIELIQEGLTDDLLEELERVASGGYA
ncbi:MAG: hypothetical protein AB2652_04785 [Candidatus Thiodiazotropha endolucinida]